MKKAVYKKIDEKIEYITIHHDEFIDENGKVIAPCDEVVKKVIPIMGTVYEELTEDEILSLENETSDNDEISDNAEPTLEERLEAMENAMLEMILGGTL